MTTKRIRTEQQMAEHAVKRATEPGDAVEGAPAPADYAEDVLRMFCDAVENGQTPDERVLEYLAQCLREVLSGTDASKALNLSKRKAGQRRQRTSEGIDDRNMKVARAIVRRMNVGGQPREEAIEDVAASMGVSTSVARKAYEAFSKHVRSTGLD